MAGLILKNKLLLVGGILGAIGGFLYYYWIGCTSGSCAITSNPISSSLYGALMGALALNMFPKRNPDSGDSKQQKGS